MHSAAMSYKRIGIIDAPKAIPLSEDVAWTRGKVQVAASGASSATPHHEVQMHCICAKISSGFTSK